MASLRSLSLYALTEMLSGPGAASCGPYCVHDGGRGVDVAFARVDVALPAFPSAAANSHVPGKPLNRDPLRAE